MSLLFGLIFLLVGFGVIIGWAVIYVILQLRKEGIKITEGPLFRYSCWVVGFILIILVLFFGFVFMG